VLRHRDHRSIPEIHQALRARGVAIAERSVTNLLDRYDELLATSLTDSSRLRALLAEQGRVILAIDGLQPDAGHEVLMWTARGGSSGNGTFLLVGGHLGKRSSLAEWRADAPLG
jgi:hypothetical protein